MMKNALSLGALSLGLLGAVQTANAGAGWDNPLSISSTDARGSMKSVRNGGSSSDYIGCSVYYYGNDYGYLSCTARNSSTSLSCFENAGDKMTDFKRAIAAMNADSYIYFKVGSDGRCANLVISNYSFNRE